MLLGGVVKRGDLLVVKSGRFGKAGAGDLCALRRVSPTARRGDLTVAAPAHQDGTLLRRPLSGPR